MSRIPPPWQRLEPSPRQIQIAQLLADGYQLGHAAEHLYISRNTAKRHLEQLSARLNKRGQAAVVAELMRRGLVT